MKLLLILLVLLVTNPVPLISRAQEYPCNPTPPDADGPFYRPNAPERTHIGSGYLLMGQVKSASNCVPISGAKIEVWMAGPDGIYGDEWRATLVANKEGRYHVSSHFPGKYGNRPPHIHLIVNAPGYRELITQHYMVDGQGEAVFDLVLIPAQ